MDELNSVKDKIIVNGWWFQTLQFIESWVQFGVE